MSRRRRTNVMLIICVSFGQQWTGSKDQLFKNKHLGDSDDELIDRWSWGYRLSGSRVTPGPLGEGHFYYIIQSVSVFFNSNLPPAQPDRESRTTYAPPQVIIDVPEWGNNRSAACLARSPTIAAAAWWFEEGSTEPLSHSKSTFDAFKSPEIVCSVAVGRSGD